jgi:hypothetical protein
MLLARVVFREGGSAESGSEFEWRLIAVIYAGIIPRRGRGEQRIEGGEA